MTVPQNDDKGEVVMTTNNDNKSLSPLSNNIHPIQSIAVISIAGFGGALAGLSMSRRVVTQIPPTMHNVQLLSNQLPWLWSISCASFAGIVEFSTLVSPTKFIIETLRESFGMTSSFSFAEKNEKKGEGEDMVSSNVTVPSESTRSISDINTSTSEKSWQERLVYWDDQSTAILGDYALGGAIAGAIFKGSQLRPIIDSNTTTPTNSATTSSTSQSSYNYSSSYQNQKLMSQGAIKQKSTIGRGKIVTLKNKHEYQKRIRTEQQQQPKQSISSSLSSVKNQNKTIKKNYNNKITSPSSSSSSLRINKTGLVSGLLPGISLGLLAGLFQIGITRLLSIAQDYENEISKNDINADDDDEKVVKVEEEDEIKKKVKSMSTEEIKREIQALKQLKAMKEKSQERTK